LERYTCPRELLPVIESALAAEGYTVEQPIQRAVGGSCTTIMTRGAAVIMLHEDRGRDMADIHVHRNGEVGGLVVLEELPRLLPSTLGNGRNRQRI